MFSPRPVHGEKIQRCLRAFFLTARALGLRLFLTARTRLATAFFLRTAFFRVFAVFLFLAAVRGFFATAATVPGSTPRNWSRIAGFSSVETSWVIFSPRAMARNKRRMILPERVLGRLSAKRMSSGLAMAP